MHLICLNRIVKTTIQSGLVCAALGSFSVVHAYIDERPPAPIKNNAPSLIMETENSLDVAYPDADVTSKVGISGDFSHSKWTDVPSVNAGEVALAEALILLHYPVINQAVQLNAEPYLLSKRITLKSGLNRRAQLENIARQIGAHIHFGGSMVTFSIVDPIVAARGAGETTSIKKHPPVPNQEYKAVIETATVDKKALTIDAPKAPPKANSQLVSDSVTIKTVETSTQGSDIKGYEVKPSYPVLESDALVDTSEPNVTVSKKGAPVFNLTANDMLSTLVEDYARKTGVNIIWEAEIDYKIAVGFDINEGNAVKNIQTVLSLYKSGPRPLTSTFYERQSLLVIQSALY